MDDLFAAEPMASERELNAGQQQKEIVLTESRSYEDPALLKDSRVLDNIIERQSSEGTNLEGDYFQTVQTEIKPHMRKIVSDWMLEVSEEQQCQPDVFHLAINYMDRFLSKVHIKKSQFQLLGAVCLFLASKFKEVAPLPAENLVIYTDNSITTYEITVRSLIGHSVTYSNCSNCSSSILISQPCHPQQWELVVLDVLGWELSAVTAYYVLDHLLRSIDFTGSNCDLAKVRLHAETFQALAATEHTFLGQSPAVVALACLAAALKGLSCGGLEELFEYLEKSTGVKKVRVK